MNVEAPRTSRKTTQKTTVKGRKHVRHMHANWRVATRAANRLRRRRSNPEPNVSFKNELRKWKKKRVNNAKANDKNEREFARLEGEAAAAAAAGEGPPPLAHAINKNWGGEEAAEGPGDSVFEMFAPERKGNSNPKNHGKRELQMIIDDMYRKLIEADNQAVPVRQRLRKFLEDGGVVMPRDKFAAAFEHAEREYLRN